MQYEIRELLEGIAKMHECILTHTHTFCAYVSYRNLNILIDNYIIFSTIYV